MPRPATRAPAAVKNWAHVRSITFAKDCATDYRPEEGGNLEWVACPEEGKTCTLTITFSDGKEQKHEIPRGGGVRRDGDTITVYETPVFKCK